MVDKRRGLAMRKPILMEKTDREEGWPTSEIEAVKEKLYRYLDDYLPEKTAYTKHAIMGPVGKLIEIVGASRFGDNVDSYVGYIVNVHENESKKGLTTEGMASLREAVAILMGLKSRFSERTFLKILRSVDYGVYFMKMKDIKERSEAKKAGGEAQSA